MELLRETIGTTLTILGFVLIVPMSGGLLILSGWSLQPILERRRVSRPIQFQVVDLAALVGLLSIVAGLFSLARGGADEFHSQGLICPFAFVALLIAGCWWQGVVALSRAGIRGGMRRSVTCLLVVPCIVFCSAYVAIGSLVGAIAVGELFEPVLDWSDVVLLLALPGSIALALGLILLCRRLSRWVAAE